MDSLQTPPNSSPIFIGGAGRSGTTLIRVILDTHSRIACGPELKVTPLIADFWVDFQTKYAPYLKEFHLGAPEINNLFGNFLEGLLAPLKEKSGATRVAEKTPNNVFYFPHLQRMLPDASFIHVIRDGRDVIASLLRMDWRSPDGQPVPYTKDPVQAARYWAAAVQAGRHFAQTCADKSKYFELRYEAVIASPREALQSLFAFLDEPWEEQVLAFHQKERPLGQESSAGQVSQELYPHAVERWKNDLSQTDRSAIKAEIGPLLIELGYADDLDW